MFLIVTNLNKFYKVAFSLFSQAMHEKNGRLFSYSISLLLDDRNQVDPACSHTLVSKIKPCMFKHKYYKAKLRMAHYISYNILDSFSTWITVVILELIHD